MIPAEAVEAAAKAMYEGESYLNKWDWPTRDQDREEYRSLARKALSAAMPQMLQYFANRIDWRCSGCEDQIGPGAALKKLHGGAQ